jgi:hypothetical protein
MKEAGKGGEYKKNRRRHSRRRGEDAQVQTQGRVQNPADGSMKAKAKLKDRNKGKSKKSAFIQLINDGKLARKTQTNAPRPKWVAPKAPDINLAPTECVWCGKPIDDFSTALSDPASGQAGHFDCAVSRLSERERLETGDTVGYIGGGRFGVINFENAENPKTFRIKKILEWESTEARSEWRNTLSEHFSVT